jgi:hypothetical protein
MAAADTVYTYPLETVKVYACTLNDGRLEVPTTWFPERTETIMVALEFRPELRVALRA